MEVIHNNPFRILGLPVSASEREIAKRVSDLEIYAEMGKSVSYETDFPFLSPVERSLDTVRHASNQIETVESRFFYSLFWFWKNNSGDDLALDVLKDGNIDTAIKLLEKQLSGNMDVSKSYSSAKNLSVLHMALARKSDAFSFEDFSKGLIWAGKIMNADFLSAYANHIAAKHFIYEKDKIIGSFIDEIVRIVTPKLDKPGGISLPQFISNFSSFPDETKRRVSNRFISKHLQTIDDAIALSEKDREASPAKANLVAKALCESTKSAIKIVRETLGKDDYSYQGLADKLATEIENCSTDYYNYHFNNETGVDPGEASLKISKYAKNLATSLNTKNRIDEGIVVVEKWITGKVEREKQKKIKSSFDFIFEQLNSLPDIDDIQKSNYWQLLQTAKSLLNNCKPPLEKASTVLGPHDETYLKLSSAVVGNAMDLCIEYANETDKSGDVIEIFRIMSNFSMDQKTKERYQRNNTIFTKNSQIERNLNPITKALKQVPSRDTMSIHQINQLPEIAENLIDSVTGYLANLKALDVKLYLNVSSAVANTALNLCIEHANQSGISSEALSVMKKIAFLDMEPELKGHFNNNLRILSYKMNSSRKSSNSGGGGCYIATMVYGSYEAPQVLVLRKFRDDVLSKADTGRLFIKCYYRLSPCFVKHFGKFKFIHLPIKYILDRIVRSLT
jgi:hypothetical protein